MPGHPAEKRPPDFLCRISVLRIRQPLRVSEAVRLTPDGYTAHLELKKSAQQKKAQTDQESRRSAQEARERRRDRNVMIVAAVIGCVASLAASLLTVLAEHWLPILLKIFAEY